MDIHASPRRDGKDRGGKNLAIGHDRNQVGAERFQNFQEERVSYSFWLEDGKVFC
jgi:hypothetical protein